MNKTQTKIEAERYEAKQMKVKELRHRSVICASYGEISSMDEDENTDI